MGKLWMLKMVARAGAVRRSARLIAAAAGENSGHPQAPASENSGHSKLENPVEGVISGSKRSTRVSRTKSQVKSQETIPTVVDAESVFVTNEAQSKQIKTLRRTKSLKKFPSRDLEVWSPLPSLSLFFCSSGAAIEI